MSGYVLSPAFVDTSAKVLDLALCEARLQLDARYPWLVLIPRVAAAREIEDLDPAQRGLLMDEILAAGAAVRAVGAAMGLAVEKLNVGALGNVTPQLHVHVVGRRSGDPAWPGPVWGHGTALEFAPEARERALEAARGAFGA